MNKLKFRTLDSTLSPVRAHPTDAGLDLRAAEDITLAANLRTLIDTGIQVKIPKGYVGLLVPRSSLSKKGIIATNSVGIIDSDYRGNIMASLMYTVGYERTCTITKGERIMQLIISPIELPIPEQVYETDEEWNDTERGTGGFGSTGV